MKFYFDFAIATTTQLHSILVNMTRNVLWVIPVNYLVMTNWPYKILQKYWYSWTLYLEIQRKGIMNI